MLDFSQDWCQEFDISGSHEWLVTNGIGGYASGTVAGQLSRRYHGLLIAALTPPLGRTVLVSLFEETVFSNGKKFRLFTRQQKSGNIHPQGFKHLDRFHLEGTIPVWTYSLADAQLDKRIWMQPGSNTTYIHYTLRKGSKPLEIQIRTLVNFRDHHSETKIHDWQPQIDKVQDGIKVTPDREAIPYYLFSNQATFEKNFAWQIGFLLGTESYRGLPDNEDLLSAGNFSATIQPGESITLIATTQENCSLDGDVAYSERKEYENRLISRSGNDEGPEWVKQLILSADQFIVRRSLPDSPQGNTVIAGYPWFGDWGRDTMISLPGLTTATGRSNIAKSILMTFAQYVDRGMLPNNFPEVGETPGYNTVDATLWYFEAIRSYYRSTGDDLLLSELFPVLQEIIDWHVRGTRYNIHLDPQDGLMYAGKEGVQLTWMDAKIDDWVVTPRIGKPVEINALWYNALRIMGDFAEQLGKPSKYYRNAAKLTKLGFNRFWNSKSDYCYDVIDGPAGDDPSLRPNQVIAASLFYSPLDPFQVRAVVDVCIRHLLTPYGLRSLSPFQDSGDPNDNYIGKYGGNRRKRDAAYHQGTVWGWLLGPFISAYLRAHRDPIQAKNYLKPIIKQLTTHGIGSISEIFDGDIPFSPRGCIAQAWSVAEILRVRTEIHQYMN